MGSVCGPLTHLTPRSSVLVPLYIYPSQGAWDPLYAALRQHPSLNFIVVVNPNSGPGLGDLPDANYTKEIPILNSFPNVQTLGYVAITYANKPQAAVLAEVSQYGGWAKYNPQLAMKGIFLDETPATAASYTYLDTLATTIRRNSSWPHEMIVMNPGIVPDSELIPIPDLTVAFEERYESFAKLNTTVRLTEVSRRRKLACVLHSIPTNIAAGELKDIVRQMREVCGSVFFTLLDEEYYHAFDPRFNEILTYMEH